MQNLNPHNTSIDFSRPSSERRVVLTYKNFPVAHHVSHIGLGVSALNTAKVLRQNGIHADVWPILGAKDLAARIAATNPKPSHIVIGAPWIPTLDLQAFLIFRFPDIEFSVVSFQRRFPFCRSDSNQELQGRVELGTRGAKLHSRGQLEALR